MKLAILALAPAIALAASAQATTDFNRVYAGGQFVSSSIGFRLGGEYVFNDNILLAADYRLYTYNDTFGSSDYDLSVSLTRVEAGMLFPIDSSQFPIPDIQNISAYAIGGLAVTRVSTNYSDLDASTLTIAVRGGLRADVTEDIWADVNLGLIGSGGGLTLGSEVGYQINDAFDVSAFVDFGSFDNGGIGLLGSFKF